MSKRLLILLPVLVVMAVVAVAGASSEAQEEIPSFRDEAFTSPQRPAALFDHDAHMEMSEDDCGICHHVYENGVRVEGETSEDSACSDCHNLESSADNPVPLMKAYHTNCITCHEQQAKGPVMCGQCHKK